VGVRDTSEEARADDAPRPPRHWMAIIAVGVSLAALGTVFTDYRPIVAVVTGAFALTSCILFVTKHQRETIRPLAVILASGPIGLLGVIAPTVQEVATGRPPDFPGLSEVFFAACYVALIIGIEGLRRARTAQSDSEGLVDGTIVSVSISLVVWVVALGPALRQPGQSGAAIATNLTFGVLSAVIIAVTVRLAIGPGARAPSWYLLAVAIAAFVTADVAVSISPDIPPALSPIVYTFFGAAVLHPSMPRLVERDLRPTTRVGMGRFVMLAIALVVAPLTLVVLATEGDAVDLVVVSIGSLVLSGLVLVRLTLLIRAGSEQARLEQALRQASERLLQAADRPALEAAAFDAARLLIGRVSDVDIAVVEQVSEGDVAIPLGAGRPSVQVHAPGGLPAAQKRALGALATNVALALETAELSEALQRTRSERRFRALVENSSDLVMVIDADGLLSFVSPAARRLLGRDEATLMGTSPTQLPFADDVALLSGLLERADATSFTHPVEVRLRHVDGTPRWFEVAARDLRDEPEIAGFVLNCREVSDRKDAELRLFRSEARFRALVQNVSDVVAVIDDWGRFTYVSPAVTPLLGYRAEQLLDTPATSIIATDQRHLAQDLLLSALRDVAERSNPNSIELRAIALDGSIRTLDVTVSDLRHEPAVHGIVLNARDVTVRKQLESSLRHQAHHDALTGLANRTRFTEMVEHAAAEGASAACVLFVDLDDFKTVNDSLGHAVGDELLIAVAGRLSANLPPEATPARLGGDEFAVLVRPTADDLGPVGVALRLLHELRVPFDINGWEIVVTASIGIAAIGGDGITAEVVLRNADMAMYLAKERGKDRVELFEEAMHVTAFERLELKADLARAITSGQLALVYQPVVSLETGRITGAEALVRWDHPRRGRLSPDAFIAIAEETGLIVQLGQWVLEEACQQLRTWQLTLPPGAALSMSVNLSVRQLEQASIVDAVRDTVDQFGLDPKTLTLEITETVIIDHMETDRSRLTALKELGVQIALDDFGVGYSSLRYVDDLPVDILKVDRSFVGGITGSEPTPVLEAIVALGGRLGVHTVAEGIENPHQLAALKAIGCDLGQGYWFSPPLAPDAYEDLLARNIAHGGFDTSAESEGGFNQEPDTSGQDATRPRDRNDRS